MKALGFTAIWITPSYRMHPVMTTTAIMLRISPR
ncbi:MAG: hypothetical protein U0K50_03555 [Segatella copri]|nr:hypothetical protein [Segatella copri]